MALENKTQSGHIPKEFINELTQRLDGPGFIGQFVKLKKVGGRQLGLCPFHKDSKPSFYVWPEGNFHCFGCGKSGSAFKFLMEKNAMSFPEAVAEIAAYVGVEVPKKKSGRGPTKEQQLLYDLLERCTQIYERQLTQEPEDSPVKRYIESRGISKETIDKYRIGFSLDSWTGLHEKLDDVNDETLIKADVLVNNVEKNRLYDRFRNRLIFPIRNRQGNVVGFGGRVIGEGDPKYLNSKQTPVFSKARELYGLFDVLRKKRRPERILLVEGYMDVVGLSQFGIEYAAAVLGTSPNSSHFRTLFWFTKEVVVCFDGDEAGRKAASRALESTLEHLSTEHSIRFMFLPEGEDPDSLIKTQGKAAFEKLVNESQSIADYFVDQLIQGKDRSFSSVTEKAKFVDEAVDLIRRVKHDSMRQILGQEIASAFPNEINMEALLKPREPVEPEPDPFVPQYEDAPEPEFVTDESRTNTHYYRADKVNLQTAALLCPYEIWSEIRDKEHLSLLAQLKEMAPDHPITSAWDAINENQFTDPAALIAFINSTDPSFANYLNSIYQDMRTTRSTNRTRNMSQFDNTVQQILTMKKKDLAISEFHLKTLQSKK